VSGLFLELNEFVSKRVSICVVAGVPRKLIWPLRAWSH